MKKIIVCFVLWGSMLNAQFFDTESEEYFENQTSFNSTIIEEPDQGVDNGGNPTFPIPINQWLLILPIISLIIGVHYLKRSTIK